MHRTIAILHKITAQSGFARAYPRLRRAKNGVFSIVVLSAPTQSCNMRTPKLLIPAVAPPKHVSASRQTAMLVLNTIYMRLKMLINAFDAYTHSLACWILAKMHAAPYGTRLRQARSESELRRTGLGALLGGPGALPQAFGAVENARVRVWLCGKCQTGRRTRGLCATALIR